MSIFPTQLGCGGITMAQAMRDLLFAQHLMRGPGAVGAQFESASQLAFTLTQNAANTL